MSGTGHWRSQKERGAAWAIAFLLWTAKHLGRRVARFVTFFPVVWFFLTGSRARAAVRDYLGRVRPSKPARLIDVWRQF